MNLLRITGYSINNLWEFSEIILSILNNLTKPNYFINICNPNYFCLRYLDKLNESNFFDTHTRFIFFDTNKMTPLGIGDVPNAIVTLYNNDVPIPIREISFETLVEEKYNNQYQNWERNARYFQDWDRNANNNRYQDWDRNADFYQDS